ncbi:hypothetical protein [Algoriphagus formosus]|uniref:hypothetical protein n=1 Tax=Algoriphagus formosus TaxID=2007308 RepID=UPI003F708718
MRTLKFKNSSLIKKESENPSINETTYRVEKGVKYLGEVISELPSGIINKTKTGVGATSLELETNRNSIIVEPLKVTASSKSLKSTKYLYVGSQTESHERISDSEIREYLNDPTIIYKKLICVTDSLPRVIALIGDENLEKYFLLLDESDSLQTDSGFRKNMLKALKIFKDFKPENRALISATPIKMHDPYFEKVEKTVFEFEERQNYDIQIIDSDNYGGTVIDEIIRVFKGSEDEKVVVAYNSVLKIKCLADCLVENGIPKSEISVLCGKKSQSKVKGYNNCFKNGDLETRITFKTSAYFTGFDIEEQYHLLVVVDNREHKNSPSINRLIQIAGRARKGLKSFTIVQNYSEEASFPKYDLVALKETASEQISAIKCMSAKKVTSSISAKKNAINAFLNKASEENEGFNLVSLESDDTDLKFEIAYPSIDALLDIQETRDHVYNERKSLFNQLKHQGFTVSFVKKPSTTKVPQFRSRLEIRKIEKELIKKAIEEIKLRPFSMEDRISESTNPTEERIYQIFIDYRGKFDNDQIIKLLEDAISSKNISKRLDHIESIFSNELIKRENSIVQDAIEKNLPIGKRILEEEICEFTQEFLEKASLELLVPSNSKSCEELLSTFVNLEHNRMSSKRIKSGHFGSKPFYKVISHDPLGYPLEKFKFGVTSY